MAFRPSQRRSKHDREEVKLNMIPIMNLFIVIIPLLITMWASIHLTMLHIDFTKSGQPSQNEDSSKNGEDGNDLPIVSIGIFEDKFELKVDEEDELFNIPTIEEENTKFYDFSLLDEKLNEVKEKYSKQQTIQLYASNSVDYGVMIKTMDICKYRGFINVAYLTTQTYFYKTK